MNLGEDRHLSGAMVRHAALNMGLLDKQLVESILALNEKDYNLLLVEAQQFGGNLDQAISALRDGRELLTKVSSPPQVQVSDDDDDNE